MDLKNSPFVPANLNRERRLQQQVENEKAKKKQLENLAKKAEEKKKRKNANQLLKIEELDRDSKMSS